MSDDLLGYLANNERYASSFVRERFDPSPSQRLAVVTCMDARIDVHGILGLHLGEAHVIRNAGGTVTDDVIRSLVISQRQLGTDKIVVIQHTECGLLSFTDDQLKKQIASEVGLEPDFDFEAFSDLDLNVIRSVELIKTNPFIPEKSRVQGFVYDLETGRLREVENHP